LAIQAANNAHVVSTCGVSSRDIAHEVAIVDGLRTGFLFPEIHERDMVGKANAQGSGLRDDASADEEPVQYCRLEV
jgi:hypothetical protein